MAKNAKIAQIFANIKGLKLSLVAMADIQRCRFSIFFFFPFQPFLHFSNSSSCFCQFPTVLLYLEVRQHVVSNDFCQTIVVSHILQVLCVHILFTVIFSGRIWPSTRRRSNLLQPSQELPPLIPSSVQLFGRENTS